MQRDPIERATDIHPLLAGLSLLELTQGLGEVVSAVQKEALLSFARKAVDGLTALPSQQSPSGYSVARPPEGVLSNVLLQLVDREQFREISVLSGYTEHPTVSSGAKIFARNSIRLALTDGSLTTLTVGASAYSLDLRIGKSTEGAPSVHLRVNSGFRARSTCLYQFDLLAGTVSTQTLKTDSTPPLRGVGPIGRTEVQYDPTSTSPSTRLARDSDYRLVSEFLSRLEGLCQPFNALKLPPANL